MPSDVTVKNVIAWFCVGVFLAAGWTLGAWSMARLIALIVR
jgi:hypothetical protein